MKNKRLDSMLLTAVSLDLESDLIQPGLLAPPMVLGSSAQWHPELSFEAPYIHGSLLTKDQVRRAFEYILNGPSVVLCGANIAYDLLVLAVDFAKRGIDIMDRIFAMYDPENEIVRGDCDGRVFEIQLAEPLHAIAQGHVGKHALSGETIVNKQTGRPGRYSLDAVTFEVLGREDAKANDRFRMSYAQFHDVPFDQLPFEARQYPIDDAKNTHEAALAQAGHLPSVNLHNWVNGACIHCGVQLTVDAPQACMRKQRRRNLNGLARQAYYAWAAHLGSAWGFHVPQDEVDKLEKRVDDAREAASAPFKAAGIVRDNGSVNEGVLKHLTAIAYGARDLCPTCNGTGKVPSEKTEGRTKVNCKACDGCALMLPPTVPRTPSGEIGCSRDALCESGDELLMDFGEQPSRKIKTTYIPLLRRGRACNVCGATGVKTKYKPAHEDWCTAQEGEAGYREVPITPRVDPLKETERAAVEDGLHGIPRKGGVRECFQSRPGRVFSSEDWTAGELVTLAWNCLKLTGRSVLADALNAQHDVHLALAGTLCGKSYDVMLAAKNAKEQWADDLRQVAKKANFGFGGGMGELEFITKPCRADPDLFTPCPGGPSERGGVRGFNGVRPCISMDHESYCGRPGEKVTEYNDKPCSPVCIRCLQAGKRAREAWFTQWPEMREYFRVVKRNVSTPGPSGTPEVTYSDGMVRGGLGFCVSGAMDVHTRDGLVKARDLAGKTVDTLSEGGVYRPAKWDSFGAQEIYEVEFDNGDIIETTAEHRWKVLRVNGSPEWVPTVQLKGRNVPMQHLDPALRSLDDTQYKAGVRHGLIFGDGWIDSSRPDKSMIRQYCDSMHLVWDYFPAEARLHHSNKYVEGTAFAGHFPAALKTTIPAVADNGRSYTFGFLAGYLAADGTIDAKGNAALHSAKRGDLVVVRRLAAELGIPTTRIYMTRELNPWNGERAPLYRLAFSKAGLDPRLVLKNKHREFVAAAVKSNRKTRVKVAAVRSTGRFEEVFCCVEPETHTWVVGPGYLTGNCDAANGYFQRHLAKAAKAAFCQVQRECVVKGTRVQSSEMMKSKFDGFESPLYGSRAIVLFHDEIIAEHPESVASEAATRISEVMVETLRFACPELAPAVKAEPCLMRKLFKGAKAVYGKDGGLIPWQPEGEL